MLLRTALVCWSLLPAAAYAATADIQPAAGGLPGVVLRSYVVASGEVGPSELIVALRDACRSGPICRMMGDRLSCHYDVRVLAQQAG